MSDTNNQHHEIKQHDYRHHCGRLLFRGYFPPGTMLSIRCPKCKKMYVIDKRKELSLEPVAEMIDDIIEEISTQDEEVRQAQKKILRANGLLDDEERTGDGVV